MAQAGYCQKCKKWVWLTKEKTCPKNHAPNFITDVYDAPSGTKLPDANKTSAWNWLKAQPPPIKIALGIAATFAILLFIGLLSSTPKQKSSPTKVVEKPLISKEETKTVEEEKPEEKLYLVTQVIDGDTIEIEGGQRVRYIGINTPETGQPFADEATNKNKELVEGKQVKLEKDVSETDKYGRLLRYVYVLKEVHEEPIFVNAELVKQGYANAATYPPDVAHADEFRELERQARESQVGLWAPPPEPPKAEPPPPQPAPTPAPQPTEQTVHITKTGEKYHRAGCRYLSKSDIPISLSDAKAQGYSP